MKKINFTKIFSLTLVTVALTQSFCIYGQGAQISNDLPKIVSPSPSVAAFMKFEEVPVSNYTGIPDISIPLFSTRTHSEDINLNLSLNYHPSSIKVEEDASYVGLGWSFFGGGTISRTVRGIPDEYPGNDKYGIHSSSNPYYSFVDAIGNTQVNGVVPEFIWEAHEKGKYDSEHDLYQFNFFGHSGRFYITKKYGAYQIVSLDNSNAVKIVYNSSSNTFTLYDEKGYRFEFDVKELSTQASLTQLTPFGIGAPSGSSFNNSNYVSAFHLSKVYDPNQKPLVEYFFNDFEINESSSDVTSTMNFQWEGDPSATYLENHCPGMSSILDPKRITTNTTVATKTKKITKIDVKDIAIIDFTLVNGRLDVDNGGPYRLSDITVTNAKNQVIKKINLKHDYSVLKFSYEDQRKRLSLSSVNEVNGADTLSYKLSYLNREYDFGVLGKDYWGYPNLKSDSNLANPNSDIRTTSPLFCTLGVLNKMTLPTGGAIIYSFEANKYSYIGSQEITDFAENPDNWTRTFSLGGGKFPIGEGGGKPAGGIAAYPKDQIVVFHSYITGGGSLNVTVFDASNNPVKTWALCNQPECEIVYTLPAGYHLEVTFNHLTTTVQGQGDFFCDIFRRKETDLPYLYGGGIRVSKIGYFEDGNVPQEYYDAAFDPNLYYPPIVPPAKQKNYSYTFFDDAAKSSGALVFPKPIYDTTYNTTKYYYCGTNSGAPVHYIFNFTYDSKTSFNNLKVLNTHGADVGYKNVQVTETGNGYSRYEYKSPIDVPEDSYAFAYPFMAPTNKDYKRGLLSRESHFDQAFKILNEKTYDYDYNEGFSVSGYKIFTSLSCPFIAWAPNYASYASMIENCNVVGGYSSCAYCSPAANYISYVPIREDFGWVPMKQKINKDYFYNGTTLQGTVETKELFTNNYTNKQISTHTTYTYGTTETTSTEYTYYNNTTTNNIANIQQIVSKKNGSTLGTQKIIYSASNFKPLTIQASKGTLALENRVQFVKYDDFCNVLDVKKENGTSTAYVWGYKQTQPIAMIEGIGYDAMMAICSAQVNAAITESNSVSATQASINTKLDAIRAALPNAMVTTYTYKPLVGVTSITDPKGLLTTYTYDVWGRLIEVRDQNNNMLSENKYNYRPNPQY
jgi:YD repeat-containing protein